MRSIGLILAVVIGVVSTTTQLVAQSDEVIDTANRLGLANVPLRYYERQVNSGDSDLAKSAAEKLAGLYARRLISISDEASLRDDLIKRVAALIQRFPETNTTSLQVLLLEAKFAQGERLITDWTNQFTETSKLIAARELLVDVGQELHQHQKQARAEIDEILENVDIEATPATSPVRKRWDELNRIYGRALYYSGWSNFYVSSIGPSSDSNAAARAREAFKTFLNIESDGSDYSEYVAAEPIDDEIQLQLFDVYRIRSVIGLGLTEYVSGNEDSATHCFNWLKSKQVGAAYRDALVFQHSLCLLRTNRINDLKKLVTIVLDSDTTQNSTSNIQLFTTLIRYGHQVDNKDVLNHGVSGLAKIERQDVLAVVLNKYDIELRFGESFFIDSVLVAQQLNALDDNASPDDRHAVIKRLEILVEHEEANKHRLVTARNNQSLAQLHYQSGDFRAAGEAFERAATGFSIREKDAEAELLFNAFVCFYKLREDDTSVLNRSKTLLQRIKNEHPGHPLAAKANSLIGRLEKMSLDTASQITRLDQMSKQDPRYAASRYELCMLLHTRWREIGANRVASSEFANRLVRETNNLMNLSGITSQQKLRACLLVSDVTLNGIDQKSDVADQYLAKAEVLFDALDDATRRSLLPEFHYRRYQWAKISSPDRSVQHARWLAENANGSPFQLPGLIVLVRDFEAEPVSPTDEARNQEGYKLYLRIANLQNVFDDDVAIQGNVQVVLEKLGQYAERTSQQDTAVLCYRKLVSASPKNRNYLVGGGRAAVATADFEFGLTCWRPLVQGLPKGSDQWLEAKYYQIQCLRATDINAARKVLSQFHAIYPNPGSSEFGQKLKNLSL